MRTIRGIVLLVSVNLFIFTSTCVKGESRQTSRRSTKLIQPHLQVRDGRVLGLLSKGGWTSHPLSELGKIHVIKKPGWGWNNYASGWDGHHSGSGGWTEKAGLKEKLISKLPKKSFGVQWKGGVGFSFGGKGWDKKKWDQDHQIIKHQPADSYGWGTYGNGGGGWGWDQHGGWTQHGHGHGWGQGATVHHHYHGHDEHDHHGWGDYHDDEDNDDDDDDDDVKMSNSKDDDDDDVKKSNSKDDDDDDDDDDDARKEKPKKEKESVNDELEDEIEDVDDDTDSGGLKTLKKKESVNDDYELDNDDTDSEALIKSIDALNRRKYEVEDVQIYQRSLLSDFYADPYFDYDALPQYYTSDSYNDHYYK